MTDLTLTSFFHHIQGPPPEGEAVQPAQPTQSTQPPPPVQPAQPAPPTQSCQPVGLSQPGQPPSSKIPQVSQEAKGTQTVVEQTRLPPVPANRPVEPHGQVQRTQAETSQTSYPSPVSVSLKPDLPAPLPAQAAPKQPLFVPTTSGPSTPPGLTLPHIEAQPTPKQDSSPHLTSQRPVDMVQLLKVRMRGCKGSLSGVQDAQQPLMVCRAFSKLAKHGEPKDVVLLGPCSAWASHLVPSNFQDCSS